MNRLIIYYLVLLSFFYSQDKNFDISNILVSGNIEMSEQDIINFSGLSPNSSVNAIDINNAINRLWLLNRFENIQIDIDQDYNMVNLIINVEEAPILNEVIFKGSYFKFKLFKFKKSKSELKKISDLNSGTILTQQKIKAAIYLIKQDFIKRNYHDIEIEYDIIDNLGTGKKDIVFKINTTNKSKIEDIEILINDKKLKSNLISEFINSKILKKGNYDFTKRKILKILKQSGDIKKRKWYFPWTGHYDNQKLNNMNLGLIAYYRSKGYLDFEVLDFIRSLLKFSSLKDLQKQIKLDLLKIKSLYHEN